MSALRPYLLPLFAVLTLFPRLIHVPGLPPQVQLTELLFPLLLLVYGRAGWAAARRQPAVAGAVAAYCGVNLLAALLAEGDFPARTQGAVAEALGRGYLGVLAFLTAGYLKTYGDRRLRDWWTAGTAGVATLSIIAYGTVALGGPNADYWVSSVDVYPYFGEVWRLRGPAAVYGMYFMLLLPGGILAAADRKWWALGPIILASLLTLGKEIVLLPIVGLLYVATRWRGKLVRRPALAGAAGLTVFLYLATHLIFVTPTGDVSGTAYTNDRTWWASDNLALAETNYLENKRAALLLTARRPWTGYGPGQFSRWTEDLVAEGRYPANFGRFDPHSAWTGSLVETGELGFLSLLLLVIVVGRAGAWRYAPAVGMILAGFLIVSVFKDVMNFRGLWVLVGWWVSGVGRRGRAGGDPPRASG